MYSWRLIELIWSLNTANTELYCDDCFISRLYQSSPKAISCHVLQKLFYQLGSKTWCILYFSWVTDLKISHNTLYTSSLNSDTHRMMYMRQSTCKNVLCHILAAKILTVVSCFISEACLLLSWCQLLYL